MINIETIRFIKMLDKLAELSKNGIEPFKNATESTFRTKLFYDESAEVDFTDESVSKEENLYKVVWEACIAPEHHDIVCYYDFDSLEYEIRAYVNADEARSFVIVRLVKSNEYIEIEDGHWDFIA